MKIPVKNLDSGFIMPVYGFGANHIGTGLRDNISGGSNGDVDILRNAIESGITHFDTAESYVGGSSEITIGKAIKGYKREDLIIATKVSPTNLSHKGIMDAVEGSLSRLGTDYIDLYMIHFPNERIPVEETMAAMDQLVEDHIIKNIGVSNFSLKQFKEAQGHSANKIVINQVPYSLINRKFEEDGFVDYARDNDIMVTCWYPLESGRLTYKGTGLLDRMCEKYQKTPSQIALNWLISQKNVIVISGTRRMDHLEENLGSLGWAIEPDDMDLLARDFPGKEYTSIAEDYWLRVLGQ